MSSNPISAKTVTRGVVSFLLGAALLCVLATFQKTIIDSPLIFKGYIIQFLFGGMVGAIIGIWDLRLKNMIKISQAHEKNLEDGIAKKLSS